MRLALIAVGALVGCGLGPPEPGRRVDAIRGGAIDDGGFPEVVSVLVFHVDDAGVARPDTCTGTVIAPRVVMTAAHCLNPALYPASTISTVQVSPSSPRPRSLDAGWIDAEGWERFPDWQQYPIAWVNDLALVRLRAPLPGLTPAPYLPRALQLHDVGRELQVVGFGRTTTADPVGAGLRRVVALPLRGLTANSIELGDTVSAGVCNGDSGGPSYLTDRDGVRRVVGVHSWTFNRTDCADGLDSRVDLFLPFVRDFLLRSGGPTCAEDGLCASGCAPPDQDCLCATDGTCNEACRNPLNDADCPLSCAADGFCSTLDCAEPDPDCVAELSTCTKDAQCGFRTCATDVPRNERYCSRPCHQSCPDGTTCAGDVCVLPYVPPSSTPAVNEALPAPAGCSMAAGPWVLLALLVIGRRRPRRAELAR